MTVARAPPPPRPKGAGLVHASARAWRVGLAAGAAVRSTTLATTLGRGRTRARPGGHATSGGRSTTSDLERARALLPASSAATRAASTPTRSPAPSSSRSPRTRSTPSSRRRSVGGRRRRARRARATGPSTRSTPWSVIARRATPTTAGPAPASTTCVAWVPARLTAALVALVRPQACAAPSGTPCGTQAPGAPLAERGRGRSGVCRGTGCPAGRVNQLRRAASRNGRALGLGPGRGGATTSTRRSGSRATSARRWPVLWLWSAGALVVRRWSPRRTVR